MRKRRLPRALRSASTTFFPCLCLMPDTFTWSSKDGYSLVRRILRKQHRSRTSLTTISLKGNPCLLVICPTIPLQLEMSANMTLLGLDVLAINSQTRSDALRLKNEELWVVARKKPNIILTGPEQLKSAEFEKAVRDKEFCSTVSTGPIDLVPGYVMHLCWGYGS
ncbi:hypothetical protein B0H14DRAFT_3861205 [Mycena olivaceomarginata]|nr:hypothetical protein B0H14DRAFT_3861205 [Mycena olivaceomarginata]